MMSAKERAEAALAILDREQPDVIEPPAVVIMPPDSGDLIIGNAEGFVQLSIASLKASMGQEQRFRNCPWWVNYDLDWAIPGLKPDPSAHIYLPRELTGFKRLLGKTWGYGVLLAAAVCLAVGVVTIIPWVMHLP